MSLPCGIVLRENNTILVVEIFHGAKDAKEEDQKSFLCGLGVPFGGVYPDKGRAQDRLGEKIFVEAFC